MLALGQDEIAKYPFLADAGQYLKDKGFTLEQFGSDPVQMPCRLVALDQDHSQIVQA